MSFDLASLANATPNLIPTVIETARDPSVVVIGLGNIFEETLGLPKQYGHAAMGAITVVATFCLVKLMTWLLSKVCCGKTAVEKTKINTIEVTYRLKGIDLQKELEEMRSRFITQAQSELELFKVRADAAIQKIDGLEKTIQILNSKEARQVLPVIEAAIIQNKVK